MLGFVPARELVLQKILKMRQDPKRGPVAFAKMRKLRQLSAAQNEI